MQIYCKILKHTRDIPRNHILHAIFSVSIRNFTYFTHWSSCLNTNWEHLNDSNYHFPSISITYFLPSAFSVEMHSAIPSSSSFLFRLSLFKQREERNEDDDLELMATPHTSLLFFTAYVLNRIMRIWVRFKRHHRTGIVATILFFQLSDTECTVIEPRQNPISSYIKLPLLAVFSLQSVKMPC